MYAILLLIIFGCAKLEKLKGANTNYIKAIQLEDPYGNITINNNFIALDKHMLLNAEGEVCKPEDACEVLGPILSTASGNVIRHVNNRYYALTAAHFCVPDEYFERFVGQPIGEAITISMTGISTLATIEKIDNSTDLCLLSYSIDMRPKIKIDRLFLADEMPLVGEEVYAISAPLGVTSSEMRLHFDGRFGGCEPIEDMCIFTLPSTFGSSGSLVFNKKGEIIGMVQLSLNGFEHAAAGFGLKSIRNFLQEYRTATGIKLY
jgi:hypothetical protein